MANVPLMSVAHEVRVIAEELIREHHVHLLLANILYVFTDKERKRCDRVRLGSSQKLSSTERFLASGLDGVEQGPDFLILIDSNRWEVLGRAERMALVDHELCHCALFVRDASVHPPVWLRWVREEMHNPDQYADQRWGMRGHDIEEFGEVLFRHGFWKADKQEQDVWQIVSIQLKEPDPNGKPRSEAQRRKELENGNGD